MFTTTLEEAKQKLWFTQKQLSKYPCRNKDGTIEYIPVWELDKKYIENQIRYHKNKIAESEYLLSLLQND